MSPTQFLFGFWGSEEILLSELSCQALFCLLIQKFWSELKKLLIGRQGILSPSCALSLLSSLASFDVLNNDFLIVKTVSPGSWCFSQCWLLHRNPVLAHKNRRVACYPCKPALSYHCSVSHRRSLVCGFCHHYTSVGYWSEISHSWCFGVQGVWLQLVC